MNVRSTLIAATACLSLAATGCVIEPLDGDSIADRHTDNFDFWGYAYSPGDTVVIQAWDYYQGRWEDIGDARAANYCATWNGIKLYPWDAGSIHIPHHLGDNYWEHTSYAGFHHRCEVRVVDSDGYSLYTFNQNYPGVSSAISMKLDDLTDLAGNGPSLTVYSDN